MEIKPSPIPITFYFMTNYEGELKEKLGHYDYMDGRVVIYDDPTTKTILVDYDLRGRKTKQIKANCEVLDMNLLKLPNFLLLIVGSLKENVLPPFPPFVVTSNLLTVVGTQKENGNMFRMGRLGCFEMEKRNSNNP